MVIWQVVGPEERKLRVKGRAWRRGWHYGSIERYWVGRLVTWTVVV